MPCKITAAAALLILLAGCNMDEGKDKTKKSHKEATVSDSPTVKVIPVQPQDKPDPGQYCYVKAVSYKEDGIPYIDADYIQFLMGDAAIEAAKKKKEEVMDDYYIVNDNPQLRSLPLAGNFTFIAVENSAVKDRSAMDYLQTAIQNKWVLILTLNAKGEVVKIKEQFLP
ncbi:MAG: hypothetical protein JST39_07285 [Bacteroidetes bacterium]|nr:hypothetical protein [Bacteroidota bacterium]